MSHVADIAGRRVPVIVAEGVNVCAFCGGVEETRPYGPGEKEICFKCAKKPEHEPTVKANLIRFLNGENLRGETVSESHQCQGCGFKKWDGKHGHVHEKDRGRRGKKMWCVGRGFEGLYVAS